MTTMDELNGRVGSEAPSSSSSDFYTTASPNKQPNTAATDETPMDGPAADGSIGNEEDEDSSAEMDLSDSRSPSPELPPNGNTQHVAISQPPKRKLSDENVAVNGTAHTSLEGAKRPRLSRSQSMDAQGGAFKVLDLPVELWQQIFLHLSPIDLARCVRVCRTLKTYLTESKASPATNKAEAKDFSKVRVFDSEAIWAHSRKTLHPNMPRPLSRLTELQMLQLIGNKMCQFCGRAPSQLHPTSPFNCGPGAEGVRVFWPFGIRSCGKCIEDNTLKVCDVSPFYVLFTYSPFTGYRCSHVESCISQERPALLLPDSRPSFRPRDSTHTARWHTCSPSRRQGLLSVRCPEHCRRVQQRHQSWSWCSRRVEERFDCPR